MRDVRAYINTMRHNVECCLAFAFHEIRETDAGWGGLVAFNLIVALSDSNPAISFHMPKLAATVPSPHHDVRLVLVKGENQAHAHVHEFYSMKYRSHSHFMVIEVSRTNSMRESVSLGRVQHRE